MPTRESIAILVGSLGAALSAHASLGLFVTGTGTASMARTAAAAVEFAVGLICLAWTAWMHLAAEMEARD